MEFLELKRRHEFKQLLIRLGDYYESFFADAETLACLISVCPVQRGGGVLMCGFKATDLFKYQKALESRGWEIVEDFRK